jgi:xanthine dehydrogenase YagS FAD-binding subunit
MNAFEYSAPTTVNDAVALLAAKPGSEALGGGTELINRLKDYVSSPPRVVALRGIAPLREAAPGDHNISIGAGVTLSEILANEVIKNHLPALWQATLEVGTPQIRNMATLGGNLLQRPRCWYYRSGFGLLPVKDGKNLLREGDNRFASIFMTDGDALYVCPSSLAAPLIALGATATIAGQGAERTVPVAELFQVPKGNDQSELTLKPGELLTRIVVSAPKGSNASYEVRHKQCHDWPLAQVSVALEGGKGAPVSKATIVLGAVAPIPLVCKPAAAAIQGKEVTMETAEAAAKAAVASAKPLSGNAYKVTLCQTAVKRALLAAVGNRYWET